MESRESLKLEGQRVWVEATGKKRVGYSLVSRGRQAELDAAQILVLLVRFVRVTQAEIKVHHTAYLYSKQVLKLSSRRWRGFQ